MTEKQYNTEIQKLQEELEMTKKMLTEAEDRADKYEMKYDILFSVKHFS
tara:strand:- start:9 stop:155 length:147 start_codon:yes stop_codon:yes gene_type:complete